MTDRFVDELIAQRDALAAEVARLRGLLLEISKNLGWGAHIIARYEGTTPFYTCGIHNIDMSAHGNRCPECDKTP